MENERARQGRKLLWKMKEQGKAERYYGKLKSKARQKVTMENERARQGRKLLWKMKEQGKAESCYGK